MHFVLADLHGMSAFLLRPAVLLRCFILVLALLAGACGPASPKLPRLAADAVVLAFGDSLTAGYGLNGKDAYPAKLQTALRAKGYDVTITNAGVSGDTTAQGLARLDW